MPAIADADSSAGIATTCRVAGAVVDAAGLLKRPCSTELVLHWIRGTCQTKCDSRGRGGATSGGTESSPGSTDECESTGPGVPRRAGGRAKSETVGPGELEKEV